jgi:hypothetical protein
MSKGDVVLEGAVGEVGFVTVVILHQAAINIPAIQDEHVHEPLMRH